MITTQIPFAGFYGGMHECGYNRELESLADYYAESCPDDMPDWLWELASDSASFEAYCGAYAKHYAESFLDWFEIEGEYDGMISPKYYNFETDRLFIKISRSTLATIWRRADKATLTRICCERLTSRDGFISHYSNDWRTWGKLSTWDHNQIYMLILAALEDFESAFGFGRDGFDVGFEMELTEDFYADNAMWNSDKGARFWKVFNYMVERANRSIRTLDQWHAARRAENRPYTSTPLGQWALQ